MDVAPSLLGALRAGLLCRCPHCGRGPLFAGFLGVADRCKVCGFDLKAADSGDGPAVFVILIAGFLACFGLVLHEIVARPPWWLLLMIWPAVGLIACLSLLRPAKSLLIAMQFHHRAGEGRSSG
jgi:uncharacterized protein (DUF983 family)